MQGKLVANMLLDFTAESKQPLDELPSLVKMEL